VSLLQQSQQCGKRIDAAILDMTIPGGPAGVEALKRLRAVEPDLPAVASSGYSADTVLTDPRGHGYDALSRSRSRWRTSTPFWRGCWRSGGDVAPPRQHPCDQSELFEASADGRRAAGAIQPLRLHAHGPELRALSEAKMAFGRQ
jgi:CheY-like chemotaxis protein